MRARARRTSLSIAVALVAAASLRASAQEAGGLSTADGRFHLRGEVKLHFRDSTDVSVRVGQIQGVDIFERTVSPGSSFEVSTVNLIGEGDLADDLKAKVEIHFIDLYNRNPTSTGDEVRVREAWLRFGKKLDGLKAFDGTTFYVQAGKAPRFAKQLARRLESYGLWGTAVNRFEEIGVEAGGTIGKAFYWRVAGANGNPLFMRDTNALAGDNGTPDRRRPRRASTTLPTTPASRSSTTRRRTTPGSRGASRSAAASASASSRTTAGRRSTSSAWVFRRKLADHVAIAGHDVRRRPRHPGRHLADLPPDRRATTRPTRA